MRCHWLFGPSLPGPHFRLSAPLVPAGYMAPAGLHLVPVWPPRLGACLQACDRVLHLFLGHKVESHVQANSLNVVILAQRRGQVHAQLQEAVYVVGGEGDTEGPAAVTGTG